MKPLPGEHNVRRLIGTNADAIDKAEDRQLFKDAMAKIGQPTIPSDTAHDIETCVAIADRIGYPVVSGPPSPWAAAAAALPTMRKSSGKWAPWAWTTPPSPRSSSKNISLAGKRLSLR